MLRVIFVRHGVTFWNLEKKIQGFSDVQLSPDGLCQAMLLAKNFPLKKIDAIYSSDLSRAKTTAEVLAGRFNLRVQFLPEFREIDFGEWEGKTLAELQEKYPEEVKKFFTDTENWKAPNAETFLQVQERAFSAFCKIISERDFGKDSAQNIVVVAHGAVNRLILCKILEIPIRKIWAISQVNTAVNIVRVDDQNFTVELVNGSSHLY